MDNKKYLILNKLQEIESELKQIGYWKNGDLLQVEGYPVCDFPDPPNQG